MATWAKAATRLGRRAGPPPASSTPSTSSTIFLGARSDLAGRLASSASSSAAAAASSSSSSSATFDAGVASEALGRLRPEALAPPATPHSAPFMFEDATKAFSHRSTFELARAWFVLTACKGYSAVERLKPGVVEKVALPYAPKRLVRSFYNHFVAGENEREIAPVVARLRKQGVRGILDYAAEAKPSEAGRSLSRSSSSLGREYAYQSERACSMNTKVFLKAIDTVKSVTPQGFAAVKATALGDPAQLERASRDIAAARRGMADAADASSFDFRSLDCWERDLKPIRKRLRSLAKRAFALNVGLMVDAEHTFYQPAIDLLTLELQREFNWDAPLILSTYQCYLKDSRARLTEAMALSQREGWHFGTKLVRGAYMKLERERAQRMGYPSPIHDTYEDTSKNYDACLDLVLQFMAPGRLARLMVATHNRSSIEHVVRSMEALGIPREGTGFAARGGVSFAQLLGMADNITFTLGHEKFQAFKYLPYGPLDEVMPYLLRRAQENSEMLAKVDEERALLMSEIARRGKSLLMTA